VPDIVLFSQKIWESLSAEHQTWVREAGDASVVFQRKLWKEKTEQALADLKKAGVTVHRPDKAAFLDKVQGMYTPLEGTPLGTLVKRVQAVQ
jgi:TRAP-type C4-dicarboxylate transport system substrate-binding protein